MVKQLSLKELEERASKTRDRLLARFREHYHYARSLGFNSGEAQVLQKQSKATIYRLSQERREQDNAQ